jgi:hypothetical protein
VTVNSADYTRIYHTNALGSLTGVTQDAGGEYGNWFVGVARDSREPHFEAHLVEDRNDGFLYREAFTPDCAQEIRWYPRIAAYPVGFSAELYLSYMR